MAVNQYFQSGRGLGSKSEQDLVENQIIELIKMSGLDFYYIPYTHGAEDIIFGEDPIKSFEIFYPIEMYQNNVMGHGGNGYELSKFGVVVEDTVELVVSRRRFGEESSMPSPREGDLIYQPLTKALFKIDFVDFEDMFWQLSKMYTYTLKCTFYQYSYEKFDTGITKVDEDLEISTFEDPFAENGNINKEAKEDVIDFSEDNPFGEITE